MQEESHFAQGPATPGNSLEIRHQSGSPEPVRKSGTSPEPVRNTNTLPHLTELAQYVGAKAYV